MLTAAFAVGALIGVVAANYMLIYLKPEFSLDGVATVLVGLLVVVAVSVVSAKAIDHRRSENELLISDVKSVIVAANSFHEYLVALRAKGIGRSLEGDEVRRLQVLS